MVECKTCWLWHDKCCFEGQGKADGGEKNRRKKTAPASFLLSISWARDWGKGNMILNHGPVWHHAQASQSVMSHWSMIREHISLSPVARSRYAQKQEDKCVLLPSNLFPTICFPLPFKTAFIMPQPTCLAFCYLPHNIRGIWQSAACNLEIPIIRCFFWISRRSMKK